ncbi:hypothetical protein FSARC_10185 [Fusarium sarcochroum]|uniref:Uncharacterized protein n=1 Tax=Fusarium sarcochroum TaxID=1208366 RepID=A0A8H4TNW4_9HYPO|nr:hypothetical protein FSARC_10185 [Fusarium sarcochroum]
MPKQTTPKEAQQTRKSKVPTARSSAKLLSEAFLRTVNSDDMFENPLPNSKLRMRQTENAQLIAGFILTSGSQLGSLLQKNAGHLQVLSLAERFNKADEELTTEGQRDQVYKNILPLPSKKSGRRRSLSHSHVEPDGVHGIFVTYKKQLGDDKQMWFRSPLVDQAQHAKRHDIPYYKNTFPNLLHDSPHGEVPWKNATVSGGIPPLDPSSIMLRTTFQLRLEILFPALIDGQQLLLVLEAYNHFLESTPSFCQVSLRSFAAAMENSILSNWRLRSSQGRIDTPWHKVWPSIPRINSRNVEEISRSPRYPVAKGQHRRLPAAMKDKTEVRSSTDSKITPKNPFDKNAPGDTSQEVAKPVLWSASGRMAPSDKAWNKSGCPSVSTWSTVPPKTLTFFLAKLQLSTEEAYTSQQEIKRSKYLLELYMRTGESEVVDTATERRQVVNDIARYFEPAISIMERVSGNMLINTLVKHSDSPEELLFH